MSNRTVQRLLQETRRGRPIDSLMLRDIGISGASASQMLKSGWLERLSQGVYLLTGDTPSRDGCIAYLSRCIPGLHVGSGTALRWHLEGGRIAGGGEIGLWGQTSYRIPAWVARHLNYSFQTSNVFDDVFVYARGLASLPGGDPGVRVAIPERALLELASDVGKHLSLEDAGRLVAGLVDLRRDVLDEYLGHCTRVKVVRLVRDLGLGAGHPWAADVQPHVERLGTGKRWSNRTKNGRLTLKA